MDMREMDAKVKELVRKLKCHPAASVIEALAKEVEAARHNDAQGSPATDASVADYDGMAGEKLDEARRHTDEVIGGLT